ncbi:hypothetical protein EJB05_34369, partial [Eragrostis curvula]
MKFRVVCRKLYDYVRYDLKEIAFPSSLPDPPHIKKRPKLTWHDRWCILKEATRLYGASWVRNIGPELRPNDYMEETEDEESSSSNSEKKGKSSSEPSVLEDLVGWTPLDAAGMQAMDEALKAGVVPLDLVGKARTRWKVGVFVKVKFWTRISCRLRFFVPGNGTVMPDDRQRCGSKSA